jgi:flavorubredoxin
LDARIDEIVGRDKEWSTVPPPSGPKKIFLAYCSAYGYTGELAEAIMEVIRAENPEIDIQAHNVHIQNYSQLKPSLLAEIAAVDGVLLSPTPSMAMLCLSSGISLYP